MRDRCAVPRTLFQCVCTQHRNCIGRLFPLSEYAPTAGVIKPDSWNHRATVKRTRCTSHPCHPPALRIRFPRWPVSHSLPGKNAPAAFLESQIRANIVRPPSVATRIRLSIAVFATCPPTMSATRLRGQVVNDFILSGLVKRRASERARSPADR
jgi:hypothetical protein